MDAAVEKGPHLSAREPGAAEQFRKEAREKEAQGFCRILKWKTLRRDPPRDLKISPLAAVPHKSRSWRAILDLSFELEVNGKLVMRQPNELEEEAKQSAETYEVEHADDGGLLGMDHHTPPPAPKILSKQERKSDESGYIRPLRRRE